MKKAKDRTRYTCPACQEEISDYKLFETLPKTPCGHCWCKDCLSRSVEHSMTNISYFPPRCCGRPIPLKFLIGKIRPGLVRRYRKKTLERGDASPTYCYSPRCSTYIPPERIRKHIGTCGACGKVPCTLCRCKAHKLGCKEDAVWKLIRRRGWRQCKGCHNVVERVGGCQHMTYVASCKVEGYEC